MLYQLDMLKRYAPKFFKGSEKLFDDPQTTMAVGMGAYSLYGLTKALLPESVTKLLPFFIGLTGFHFLSKHILENAQKNKTEIKKELKTQKPEPQANLLAELSKILSQNPNMPASKKHLHKALKTPNPLISAYNQAKKRKQNKARKNVAPKPPFAKKRIPKPF